MLLFYQGRKLNSMELHRLNQGEITALIEVFRDSI